MDVPSDDVMSSSPSSSSGVGMETGARDRASGPALAVALTHRAVNDFSRIFIRSRWSRGFSTSSSCFELRIGIRGLWSVKILNSHLINQAKGRTQLGYIGWLREIVDCEN